LGCAFPSVIKPLYTLQKRALRIMHCLPPSSPVTEWFSIDSILTFPQLSYYRLMLTIYKIINKTIMIPDITITADNRNLSLRSSPENLLSISKIHNNYGKLRIGHIGCKLWNRLNASIRHSKSLSCVKHELKNFIICFNANLHE